jgi:hypothetical protein
MKEHYAKKLKRELLEAKQALFAVCNFPETTTSQTIISQQKSLKLQGDMLMQGTSYYDKLKEIGFGLEPPIFKHFESKL